MDMKNKLLINYLTAPKSVSPRKNSMPNNPNGRKKQNQLIFFQKTSCFNIKFGITNHHKYIINAKVTH